MGLTEGLKEAIECLVELGKEKVTLVKSGNGGEYSAQRLSRITEPTAQPVEVSTLTGLVDFIKADIDGLGEILVRVASPTKVEILSDLNADNVRDHYLVAEAQTPNNIQLNTFIAPDKFNIMLQSSFINAEVGKELIDYKDILLQVTGCIKEEQIKQVGDDGVSQQATIKTGVASVANVVVPNSVELMPYRTFVEVQQPISKFVFRMESGPKCALIEADGGRWRVEAMASIAEFLAGELKDLKNVHIIA